jgi:hypothetical protein
LASHIAGQNICALFQHQAEVVVPRQVGLISTSDACLALRDEGRNIDLQGGDCQGPIVGEGKSEGVDRAEEPVEGVVG